MFLEKKKSQIIKLNNDNNKISKMEENIRVKLPIDLDDMTNKGVLLRIIGWFLKKCVFQIIFK